MLHEDMLHEGLGATNALITGVLGLRHIGMVGGSDLVLHILKGLTPDVARGCDGKEGLTPPSDKTINGSFKEATTFVLIWNTGLVYHCESILKREWGNGEKPSLIG